MSKGTQVRCYDYINRPYEKVRDAFAGDPAKLFQSATKTAATRAGSVASELRVELGAMKVVADVVIAVKKISEQAGDGASGRSTTISLEWEAASRPQLFPFMKAELRIYPLTATETQLDLSGVYEPPLGIIGGALNAVAGHRIAESSVHAFVCDIAQHLRKTLT